MYDGDSLDAVVCLVRDAAARGGRRAAVVGTCSYGGSSGATRRRARMHTAVFAVGPEPSAEWLEDIARTLPAPVRTPGMNTTRGWTLVLGRGDEGARGRDVAVQRVAADAFAAAVAAVNRRRRRTRPKYTPRVVIVESRLLPATRAVRAAVPDADVAVAVEDDLDRLVAASAAPDGARVRETFWDALRDGDEDRETRRCDEDRETRRCDEDAVASYASGAFLDYTGRTRAFARRELASCDAWPQLTATLREFRRGASRRGVLAVVLNASDDAEYWDGLVIDYVVLGIRRAARRVAAEGTEREAEEEKKKKDDGGGGGDGGDGATAAATTRTHPRTHPRRLSIFCASRGVRPACRRARLCSWTFASRPTTIRIPTSIRIRARKKTRPSVFRFPRRYLRVFRGTWRAVRRPARTRRSSGRYPRSMHSRRRAREP